MFGAYTEMQSMNWEIDSIQRWSCGRDPGREAILLRTGDKAGRWSQRYVDAIPLAEARYDEYPADVGRAGRDGDVR